MGVDLSNKVRGFRFNWFAWEKVYDLALLFDWVPAGTEPPCLDPEIEADFSKWSGTYFTNDYQIVTEEDARNIANALERALPDIPDHDAFPKESEEQTPEVLRNLGFRMIPTTTKIPSLVFFSGANKNYLRNYIEFCREGSFTIG